MRMKEQYRREAAEKNPDYLAQKAKGADRQYKLELLYAKKSGFPEKLLDGNAVLSDEQVETAFAALLAELAKQPLTQPAPKTGFEKNAGHGRRLRMRKKPKPEKTPALAAYGRRLRGAVWKENPIAPRQRLPGLGNAPGPGQRRAAGAALEKPGAKALILRAIEMRHSLQEAAIAKNPGFLERLKSLGLNLPKRCALSGTRIPISKSC